MVGNVGQPLHPQDDCQTGVLIRGSKTYANQQRIESPDFLLPFSLGDYGTQLVADNAYYTPPEGSRPGGYLLDNVDQPKNIATRRGLRLGQQPVIVTPLDDPDWLQAEPVFCGQRRQLRPIDRRPRLPRLLVHRPIDRGLRNPSLDFGADVRVAIHARIVKPLLDITLLFLGLPLVVVRESRNVFMAIGMCVGVVSTFLLVVIGFQQLGTAYLLSPALAVWVPLMIFVPLAVWLAESMRE